MVIAAAMSNPLHFGGEKENNLGHEFRLARPYPAEADETGESDESEGQG